MTETILPDPVPERPVAAAVQPLLAAPLKHARWVIFWERLWPALTGLAAAIGLFLTLAWLGVFLWLPPLGRAAAVIACGAVAGAAMFPFLVCASPACATA